MKTPAPLFLVVGHDLSWSRPLRVELRRRGARVLATRSLDEAHRMLESLLPDLLVLDGDLDSGRTAEFLQMIPQLSQNTRILVVLSKLTSPIEEACRKTGVLCYMIKPVHPATILGVIGTAFQHVLKTPESTLRKPPHVLCVDDDALLLRSLNRLLRRHGYQVTMFDDPKEALRSIGRIGPDVAILDVRMPGMDGLTLAGRINDIYRGRIPIVLLTAVVEPRHTVSGWLHEVRYYLTKPCDPARVLDVIDYLVGDMDPTERALLETTL